MLHAVGVLRERRVDPAVLLERREPGIAEGSSPLSNAAREVLPDAVGHEKLGVLGPTIGALGQPDLLFAERLAVRRARVLLVGRTIGDVTVHDDQGGSIGGGAERVERPPQHVEIVGVADACHVPAIGDEARRHVLGERPVGVTFDRDLVVVVDPAEVGELEMTGERRRLPGNALHHAAVAGQRVDVIVEQLEPGPVEVPRHPAARDRHADAGRDALAERTRGRLDARGPAVLGVPRCLAVELAEALDIVERERGVTQPLVLGVHRLHFRQREHRVKQHRGVAHRQDEPIAVRPDGIAGVEPQEILPQAVDDRGHGHRGPGMSRLRRLHGIHRERADGVDGEALEVGRGHGWGK